MLDALAVVEGRGARVPAVMAHLAKGVAGDARRRRMARTKWCGSCGIVGSGGTARRAAVASARSHGIDAGLAGTDLTGSAARLAARLGGGRDGSFRAVRDAGLCR